MSKQNATFYHWIHSIEHSKVPSTIPSRIIHIPTREHIGKYLPSSPIPIPSFIPHSSDLLLPKVEDSRIEHLSFASITEVRIQSSNATQNKDTSNLQSILMQHMQDLDNEEDILSPKSRIEMREEEFIRIKSVIPTNDDKREITVTISSFQKK
jgi:hypothetical protein